MRYAFIEQWRAEYPLTVLCRVLEVSTSAYHSWQRRPISLHQQQDALLEQRIRALHHASKCRYGTPRLQADLRAEGQRVSRKRIARLMRSSGLRVKGSRRFVRTTDSEHVLAVCPNLLNRAFDVQEATTVWASDLTFIPTKEGWLYLAVTLDLYSRAVVGQAMDARMRLPPCRWRPSRWLSGPDSLPLDCCTRATGEANMPAKSFRQNWPGSEPRAA